MNDERIEVKLGGKTVSVPIYRDRRTTLRLVRRVTEKLKQIEADSPRIDTQAFALDAALSFAAESAQAEILRESESKEVFKELDHISRELDALVREFRLEQK